MPSEAEAALRDRIIPRLLERGVFIWSNADAFGQKGLPDSSFVCYGIGGFLEYKAAGGRLMKAQKLWMTKCAQAGGLALLIQTDPKQTAPWHATYQYMLPNGQLSLQRYGIDKPDWLETVCGNHLEKLFQAF